jgi:putative FmdB family regulatory protein
MSRGHSEIKTIYLVSQPLPSAIIQPQSHFLLAHKSQIVNGKSKNMPIYEFACPKCRVVFNFLSQRINPGRLPVCPKCGNKKMTKQMSTFAMPRGAKEPAAGDAPGADAPEGPMPDLDDPRVMRAMNEMERDMAHLDENNPKHMAHMMRKMKDLMPPGTMPKEMDIAIKRLEAGEDPEKIEADMGDVLGDFMGGPEGGGPGGGGAYSHDSGLYDY